MQRRTVLALSSLALASFAGCTSIADDGEATSGGAGTGVSDADGDGATGTDGRGAGTDGGDSTPDPTPTEAVELGTAVGSVAVERVRVQQSVHYLTAPDAMDVHGPGDRQYAFVTVDATDADDPPPRGAFSLRVDDGTYEPRTGDDDPNLYDYAVSIEGSSYDPDRSDDPAEGWLVFTVPTDVDADQARVELRAGDRAESDTVAWTVPEEQRAELRPPHPEFTVESAEASTETPGDEPAMVRLTVSNDGEADGVFRAAINHQGPLWAARAFEATVSAGETQVVEEAIEYYRPEDVSGAINFEVRWAGGSESWTVDVG